MRALIWFRRVTYVDPDIVSLFGRSGELHLTLRSYNDDTILVETRWHWVRVKNRPNILDVSCKQTKFQSKCIYPKFKLDIPLLALDSETAEDPGSAELQYKVRVYG